jgi:hypothetical protein
VGFNWDTSPTGVYYQVADVREPPTPANRCGTDMSIIITKPNLGDRLHMYEPSFEAPRIGQAFSAVGYGRTCEDPNTCADKTRMRRDGLVVDYLEQAQSPVYLVPGVNFVGGTGLCSGDSGGPALDADERVMGVASLSQFKGSDCVGPSTYVRLDALKDWITSTVREATSAAGYPVPAWATGSGTPAQDAGPGAAVGGGGSSAGNGGSADTSFGASGSSAATTATPDADAGADAGEPAIDKSEDDGSEKASEPAPPGGCDVGGAGRAPSGAHVSFIVLLGLALVRRDPRRESPRTDPQ